ncbi:MULTISPECIES: PTS IIA-like nitrogen regulatory protein PtsN [Chromobacterium]|uniref:PTS IIA-like nitrogen regulatory protein PtsN n=1 Tax=Chromobacterium TaxID=535 RepID=UPI000D3191B5|nr:MULTISPECIES: PTS IIA-like nitrogen regulatory protein PtsN [Chromobacterium]MCP1289466.1 PTS IIA-like nitrogen regulatory protein PtsN [Chromobacterium sp. S0633]PTU64021.1 PTS IIA-like nitrogen-regulatory protein PtsN [Chromobacterium sp. Panama]UJB31934.1 PTS IIA-like nitrogen regulatory protein PtsN [Chromobacterium sp. Beijing]
MNLIGKILTPEHVLLDLDVASKKRVFEQVGLLVENTRGIARSEIFDCLFAREKLGSTGLGQGVAIPHGRARGLKDAMGVFIRLKTPIPFDAPDGKPVQCLFVLLVPEQATDLHLQVLSELAQLFSSRQMREQMLGIPLRDELYQLLNNWVPNA